MDTHPDLVTELFGVVGRLRRQLRRSAGGRGFDRTGLTQSQAELLVRLPALGAVLCEPLATLYAGSGGSGWRHPRNASPTNPGAPAAPRWPTPWPNSPHLKSTSWQKVCTSSPS